MTHKYSAHTSGLFLLELILAILFFSIAGAICVQLFVKSHLLSKQAEQLSAAVNECSDAAEIILSSDSQEALCERLSLAYPNAVWSDKKSNEFQIETSYEDDNRMLIFCTSSGETDIFAKISYEDVKTKDCIYELEISHLFSSSSLKEADHEP